MTKAEKRIEEKLDRIIALLEAKAGYVYTIPVETGHSATRPVYTGYNCAACGVWVNSGMSHICSKVAGTL